ncbi:MAG: AsnC family transcriptional regulator [Anaerolineae bacterium]|jgi:DNA-binding Lrp family transcriptional regulator
MDAIDRRLLDLLQESLPLAARPFAALGEVLALSEDQVLSRTRRLKEEGIIRQIGPIFSSRRLGYQSTLAAFHVSPERLEKVAARVSAHPGVSHNYSRNHHYNLWFTLTLPPDQDLEREIARLAGESGVSDALNLPSLRLFKLGVHFSMSQKQGRSRAEARARDQSGPVMLTDFERDVVRALQGDLPLVVRPFEPAAGRLGVTEERLLEAARELDRRGVMRRFSAVLRHRRAGFTANGMACWVVSEARLVEAGETAAGFRAVSHCYQRPAYPPRWPYNLFTMVHGRTQDEVESTVERIHEEIGPVEHTILYSEREFKKQRVRYFT